MSQNPCRTAAGGLIDRSRLVNFTFDGKAYTGHVGDTLASALLANGTESSRSRITASAPLSSALSMILSLIPGANKAVLMGFNGRSPRRFVARKGLHAFREQRAVCAGNRTPAQTALQ